MGPSRRVRWSASLSIAMVLLIQAAPSGAQYSPFADDAVRSARLSSESLGRSPKLAAMGRLSIVGDDPYHRLTLWDFAGNPAGVSTADSQTTLDIRPGNSGASDVRGLAGAPLGRVRQMLAARGNDLGFELWRRQGTLTYGAIGNVGSMQLDHSYSDDVERRLDVANPAVTSIVGGVMPYTRSGRTRYALSLHWGSETVDTRYLAIVRNAAGEFISLDSALQPSPNIFLPESFDVRKLGAGVAVSQVLASWLTVGAAYDGVKLDIQGDSQEKRSDAQSHEARLVNSGQMSLIGRIGRHIEWGVDGRGWLAHSETDWNFTISAGQGATPLEGRGKLLTRDERAASMRTRAIAHLGSFDLGAELNTDAGKIEIWPPDVRATTTFNHFLNVVYNSIGADSLALPDSVSHDRSAVHAWEAGGGLACHLPGRRGLVGVEYHRSHELDQTDLGGIGPRHDVWDVRGGVEYPWTPALAARAGYQYTYDDQDLFTLGNEEVVHLMTLGVGLAPHAAAWRLDLSYGIRWLRADYGDPGAPHGSRQQLVSQVHWRF